MDITTSCDSCIQGVDQAMQSLTKLRNLLNHLKEEKNQPSLSMATIMCQTFCLIEMCTALASPDYRHKLSLEEKRDYEWRLAVQLYELLKTKMAILRHAQSSSSCSTTENSTKSLL